MTATQAYTLYRSVFSERFGKTFVSKNHDFSAYEEDLLIEFKAKFLGFSKDDILRSYQDDYFKLGDFLTQIQNWHYQKCN